MLVPLPDADACEACLRHVAVVGLPVSHFFQKNLKKSLYFENIKIGNLRFVCLFDRGIWLFSRIQKICKKSL